MATIQDIVTGSMQKLGILHGSETPTANDAAYALSELNDMMQEFDGQQVYVAWQTVALTADFPLADHHIGGIKAMLAVRISSAHGGDQLVSAVTAKQADDGYSRLWGDYHRPPELSVDDGLANMPGYWRYDVDNVNV